MGRWTEEGWEYLISIADNAAAFSGHSSSGIKVIQDADRTCKLIVNSQGPWKKIQNIFQYFCSITLLFEIRSLLTN